MTIDEYAEWAQSVVRPGEESSPMPRLASLGLGLAGEAGEVADTIRRILRGIGSEHDRLAYELGDLLYFWACLCREAGLAPSAMLARSRQQIEVRLAAGREPVAGRPQH